jgi:hypothetical protein
MTMGHGIARRTLRFSWLLAALAAACEPADSGTPMSSVTVIPATAEVQVGATRQFASAVTGSATTAVTWSVSETSACGSVTQSALYSAPDAPTVCHVVATSAADASKSGSATVTVTAGLSISPSPATVAIGSTQQFTVSPSVPVTWSVVQTNSGAPAFPLKLSSSGRNLVDQNNQPWRVQADAAWLMSSVATAAQVDTYLSTRKAQGFNAFYFMSMVHAGGYGAASNAPRNSAGASPFTGALWTTPNETYWSWIDTIIDKAAAQGMVVMLAFEYLGYPGTGQGWETEVAARSTAASQTWGTWLGNRYKSKPNIIWFGLGDQTPSGTRAANHLAAINAIKAAGATQPWMAEPMGTNTDPILDTSFGSVLDMHSYYGYGDTGRGDLQAQAERDYRASPARPVWVQEGGYEFENNTGNFTGQTYETRRTRFWNSLAGGTAGDGFGSRDVYQWLNFPACLSTAGGVHSSYAFSLFASMSWWLLQPSGTWTGAAGKVLVPSGGGTRGGGSLNEITSAVTSDGAWLLAYVPPTGTTARTFSVDLGAMSGAARARWWDPTTGAYTAIATGLANSGTQSFTTPGANGAGQNDWVLVLDAAGAASPGCGSVTASGLYSAPVAVPAGVACAVKATMQSDASVSAQAAVNLH